MKSDKKKTQAGRAQTTITTAAELMQKIDIVAKRNFRSRNKQIEVFLNHAVSQSITTCGNDGANP